MLKLPKDMSNSATEKVILQIEGKAPMELTKPKSVEGGLFGEHKMFSLDAPKL